MNSSLGQYEQAVMESARAKIVGIEAEAREKIAKARLIHGSEPSDDSKYEITITHKQAAKELDIRFDSVIRLIKQGQIKALPKPKKERIYRIPLKEWTRFKQARRSL